MDARSAGVGVRAQPCTTLHKKRIVFEPEPSRVGMGSAVRHALRADSARPRQVFLMVFLGLVCLATRPYKGLYFLSWLARSSGWPHQLSLAQAPRCNRDLLPVLANALPDPRHGRLAVPHPQIPRGQTPRMLSDQLTIHEQASLARSGGQPDDGDFVLSQNCSRCCTHDPCPEKSAAKAILVCTREQTRAKRGWGEADNPTFCCPVQALLTPVLASRAADRP